MLSPQVNDFSADAIVSQLLLLDAQDPVKVCGATHTLQHYHSTSTPGHQALHQLARRVGDSRHGYL